MKLGLKYYIKDIESRVKRLEESITSVLGIKINILGIGEDVGFADSMTIHGRLSNNTFYVAYSEIGTDRIGDLRGSPVLLYSSP